MWKNYFKLSTRNLWNYKTYSLINLLGFSIGMVSVILLFFYIQGELSYDNFHKDGDKICRILRTHQLNGEEYSIGVSAPPFAPALQNDFEGIIESTVRVNYTNALIRHNEEMFVENNFFIADPNFFEFFSFPLLKGDPKTVLSQVNSIVISEEIAEKYFGQENPIGEILDIDNGENFIVTGVMNTSDYKSHLDINFVASLEIYGEAEWLQSWRSNGFNTYIKLKDARQIDELQAQLPDFMERHLGELFRRRGSSNGLILEPLSEIYFGSDTRYDYMTGHGNKQTVSILSWVALAIFLIVCFNYINLATAVSFKRSKEVGIRKVLGGSKRQLIIQFLTEAFTITFIAGLIAICLSELLLPTFNSLFEVEVKMSLYNPQNLAFLLALTGILGALAGLYPAFLLSSFSPLKALKGSKQNVGQGIFLRKSLVITQFSISIFMIISTLIIISQLFYLKNKSLGFNQEAIALIDLNGLINEKIETFKNTLVQHHGINNVSIMSGQPGGFHDGYGLQFEGQEAPFSCHSVFSDYDYIETLDLELLQGRNFSEDFGTDYDQAMILNESAVALTGYSQEEIIGKKLKIPVLDSTYHRKVIGVVKDYHFATLKNEIAPLFISLDHDPRILAIKFDPNQLGEGLAFMEKEWEKFYANYPLSYGFLDEAFYRHYETEQNQSRVFSVFAGISIFLSCLGIFGLASYTAEQRKKEMGIRRVLGASIYQLLRLLSSEFILLVVLASVLASPLAYWFMNTWLQDFAYKTLIHPAFFVIAAAGALGIAFTSIAFQTWRAARVNPVEVLKDE